MFAPPPLARSIEASFRDATSSKPAVRASALGDLGKHAGRSDVVRARALAVLERALQDERAEVRAAAAVALADIGAHEALPSLLLAMEDPDAYVRQMAIQALGEIGDARAWPRLRRALSDERPEMRYQAVMAVAKFSHMRGERGHSTPPPPAEDNDLAEALSVALGDDDPQVRYIALRVADAPADGPPLHDAALMDQARELLTDPAVTVRVAAAIYLAGASEAAACPVLLGVVEGTLTTEELEDERAAVELVGVMGLTSAVTALERRVWGVKRYVRDTCEWHARIALARLGHIRAQNEIVRDLGSLRETTRQAAVVAAGRARLVSCRAAVVRANVDQALVDEALGLLDE